MRISKKILAFTLSILMAFSMMPFTAFAADEPYADLKNTTTAITFDNKQWYLIDYDDSTVTLLSKECVAASKYDSNGKSNTYSGSTVETVVNDYYTNSISSNVKSAIVDSKMFLLTYAQASTIYNANPDVLKCSQASGADFNSWWLCSPSDYVTTGSCVSGDNGNVYVNGTYVGDPIGVRPALKLDLSKVEFDSETNTFALPAPSAYAGYVPAEADDATALAAKVVKFNGHDWYLIEDNSTSETEGTVTLFAADTSFGTSSFDANDLHNKYSTSVVKTYLDGMTETGGAFADVADAIETVTVTTDNDTDVTAKLYLLSKSEAGALPANVLKLGNFTNADYYGEAYWLRSPNPNDGMNAAYVNCTDGTIFNGSQVYRTFGVRPALKLDLSKVEFNSETNTFAEPTPAVPQATVTEATAPEGAAFAYKFEADAAKPTAYDAYHADFVATFDRDVKAGEVTLYGKYGDYDWIPVTINRDIAAGEEFRIVKEFLNDTLTYATIRDSVSPFYCGAGGAVLADTNMTVNLVLYPVESGVEGTPVEASEAVTGEIEKAEETAPKATVTEATAPEGAAFAYKFEADAAKPTAYDAYHADFVATFDRDIKAGEVTLYGKYGDYDWIPVTINRDIAAGEEFRIVKEFLNDTMTYATIRDSVSPFYCGAGGEVLANTNMSVELKLYPVEGGVEGTPVSASDVITDDIAEELPKADVQPAENAPAGVTAYTFTAPHSAAEVDNSMYKDYRCDFVVTFEKDVAAEDLTLLGSYGDYGWVEMPAQDFTAGTEYRILKGAFDDTLTYSTICKEVSPFSCGFKGASAEETGMKVELRFYKVEGGVETYSGTSAEVETTVPEKANDKFNIVLKDSIHLNVYIDDTNVTQLGVKYNKTPEKEENNTPAEAEMIDASTLTHEDGYYKLEITLAPAQIRDAITIDVYGGADKLRTINTSIANYCDKIISAIDEGTYAEADAAKIKALAIATLDYGKAASDYFGYNTAAYEGYTIANSTAPAFSGLVANDTSGVVTAVRYVAKSVPEVRFETTLTADKFFDKEGNPLYSIECSEGYETEFTKEGNAVVIEVRGIPASLLGEAIHLNVSGKANGTITYTPLAWAKVAIEEGNAAQKELGTAIANYNAAAAAIL